MSEKFSIVVPSYNQADTIGQTLDSLIAQQADVDLEILVIDGGSDKETLDEIRHREGHISVFVSEPDHGQTDALIKGFSRASGEILGWLNSDDLLLPGALKCVLNEFETSPDLDLVYGDMLVIDCENNVIKRQREIDFDLDILLWVYNYIPQPSTFWTRSVYESVGGLDSSKQCAMDFDLWMKLLKSGANFRHVDQYLSCFRFYEDQKNQKFRKISDLEDREILDNYLSRIPDDSEIKRRKMMNKIRRVVKRFTSGHYTKNNLDLAINDWIKNTPNHYLSLEKKSSKVA